jgi:hypothetical protein
MNPFLQNFPFNGEISCLSPKLSSPLLLDGSTSQLATLNSPTTTMYSSIFDVSSPVEIAKSPFLDDFFGSSCTNGVSQAPQQQQPPSTTKTSSSCDAVRRADEEVAAVVPSKACRKDVAKDKRCKESTEKQAKEEHQQNREWRRTDNHASASQVVVRTSTLLRARGEEETDVVPATLYSSIKYEVTQLIHCNAKQIPAFLRYKILVVDPTTTQEICKTNKAGILDGEVEGSLSKGKDGCFEGKVKVQFNDVSYHHGKKEFAFKIIYFLPSSPEIPMLELQSAPFLVLARKPKRAAAVPAKKKQAPKRKREEETEEEQPKSKVAKQELPLDKFMTSFQNLMNNCFPQMNEQEQQLAINTVVQQLAIAQQKVYAGISNDPLEHEFKHLL